MMLTLAGTYPLLSDPRSPTRCGGLRETTL
jgi:hypothetical protein